MPFWHGIQIGECPASAILPRDDKQVSALPMPGLARDDKQVSVLPMPRDISPYLCKARVLNNPAMVLYDSSKKP
jgi:hypothetical protein